MSQGPRAPGHLPEGRGSAWQLPYTLDLGGTWAQQRVLLVLSGQPLGVGPSLPPILLPQLSPQRPPTSSLARCCIYDDQQTQTDTSRFSSQDTYHIASPFSTVTTANVTRHCQMSPEGGKQNSPWPGGHRSQQHRSSRRGGTATSHRDMLTQALGWGTYGQCDVRGAANRLVPEGFSEVSAKTFLKWGIPHTAC